MLRKVFLAALYLTLSIAMAKAQTSSVVSESFYLPAPVNGYLYAGASTTDANGNTYIAGTFQSQNGFFIAKYNAAGVQVFDTTFGNTGSAVFAGTVNAIAVNSSGNVYIVGNVSYGGRVPIVNGYQTSPPYTYANAFLSVVSADGSTLVYSTYFNSTSGGSISSVAVDSAGSAYIVGISAGELPTTPNAPVPNEPLNAPAFVAKFNPSLSGTQSLIYSTYLGGSTGGADSANGVAVDSAGDAYVTGNTTQPYPTSTGAYRYNGRSPDNDVYVTKVNPGGTAFLYSALLGPGTGNGIALDSSNDAYITGTVGEDDYPTTSGAYQATYPSGFVTELNPSGSALLASTFLGGSKDSYTSITPTHLALPPGCASKCAVYVAGYTDGSDLPLIDPVQSFIPGSTNSGFFVELAGGLGSAVESSYFASGSGFDLYQPLVPGIGVDSSGDIYLVGDALPALLPTTETASASTGEAFIAKIAPTSGAVLAVSPSSVTFPQQVVGVSTAQQGLAPATVYLENLGSEAATISSIKLSSTIFSETNNCGGTVAAGGFCTLALGFTPSAAGAQTGTLTVASNASVNPTLQLAGSAISDRYLVAACGGVTPCPALTYADTTVGSATASQIVTVTNLGNTAVPLTSIASSLPDYNILTNCPLSGAGLGHGQSCEISIQFHATEVGLRAGTIAVKSPGTTANPISIAVSGTGLLSSNPASLVLLDKTLNFGTETLGATTGTQTVTVFNNGASPATVFSPSTSTSGDSSGVSDYLITANSCADVLPQTSCTLSIAFAPTATGTRTGTLTIPSSTTSTPLTSSLTGIGVAQKQELEFTPTAITFPEQVIDASSGSQFVYVRNVGPSSVSIDRVLISGSYQITTDLCSQTTLAPAPLNEQYARCSVTVVFSPTATGLQTGTVTVIDTEGNQSALSLAGTGVAQNGAPYVTPGALNFGTLPVGSTSGGQEFYMYNIGNSPITVTGATISGDYSYVDTGSYGLGSNPFPWNIQPGEYCCFGLVAYFTPSKVANPDNGTIVFATSAGKLTVNLTGIGETASRAIVLSPPTSASFNFGNVEVGQTTAAYDLSYAVIITNVGTDPVALADVPTISGTDASDFKLAVASGGNACGAQTLNPGESCVVYLEFSPSATGARKANLTISDNATTGGGVQTLTLAGTGTATEPTYTLIPNTVAFGPQAAMTPSAGTNLTFVNNSASSVTISSATFSPAGSFTRGQNYYGDCNEGAVSANGGKCSVLIHFAPTAAGQVNGTATLTDSTGKTYVAQLNGYATPVLDSLYVDPVGLNFAPQPQLSPSGAQNVNVYNYSTQTAAFGQATVTNNAYKITSDSCSDTSQRSYFVYAYGCGIAIALAPTSSTTLGSQSGSLKIPVTYADGTTGTYTVALTGTVVAPVNAAELSPTVLGFPDQPVNSPASSAQTITLTNNSNLPLTKISLTSTNTSASGPFIVNGNCSGASPGPNSNCYESVQFAPTAAGSAITGTLTFVVTFTNQKTQTLKATFSGNALAAKSSLVITPDSGNFGTAVVGETGNLVSFNVINNGNQSVAFGPASLTSTQSGTNFTRNYYDYNSCSNSTLTVGSTCTFNIYFTPATTSSGTVNGTLTIDDPAATGGPHKIPLVGTALATGQALTVSQTTIGFGNQPVATSSAPQALFVTNQSSSPVSSVSYALGGTDASDFTLQNNTCGSTLASNYSTQTCELLVSFTPAKASLGARTATVTVTYTLPGSSTASTLTVKLTGTGTPPAPAVTLFPASLTYPSQAVGTRSSAQYFSVYNTGSATLDVSALVSTNATEFSIASNSCSSKPLTISAGQFCLVGVTFAPSASGSRTGAIQFTDNAGNTTGSTQTVPLSGSGADVPVASFSVYSLAFGSEDVGSTSASQTVTLSNPGAVPLDIASMVYGGSDPKDFVESTSCGATLASKANCSVTVKFAPTAAGSRTASIVFTDNADGVSGSTQTISLAGTGVAAAKAASSPARSASDSSGRQASH